MDKKEYMDLLLENLSRLPSHSEFNRDKKFSPSTFNFDEFLKLQGERSFAFSFTYRERRPNEVDKIA